MDETILRIARALVLILAVVPVAIPVAVPAARPLMVDDYDNPACAATTIRTRTSTPWTPSGCGHSDARAI